MQEYLLCNYMNQFALKTYTGKHIYIIQVYHISILFNIIYLETVIHRKTNLNTII